MSVNSFFYFDTEFPDTHDESFDARPQQQKQHNRHSTTDNRTDIKMAWMSFSSELNAVAADSKMTAAVFLDDDDHDEDDAVVSSDLVRSFHSEFDSSVAGTLNNDHDYVTCAAADETLIFQRNLLLYSQSCDQISTTTVAATAGAAAASTLTIPDADDTDDADDTVGGGGVFVVRSNSVCTPHCSSKDTPGGSAQHFGGENFYFNSKKKLPPTFESGSESWSSTSSNFVGQHASPSFS